MLLPLSEPSELFGCSAHGHSCPSQGDNIANSTDSRMYGPVPLALLQGIVYVKLWPLNELGLIAEAPPMDLETIRVDDASAFALEETHSTILATSMVRAHPPARKEQLPIKNTQKTIIKDIVTQLERQVVLHKALGLLYGEPNVLRGQAIPPRFVNPFSLHRRIVLSG